MRKGYIMESRFSRSEMLFGKAGMQKLSNARVAVFGIGGVGGYTVEALARSGIGTLDLIDSDTFSLSNINRQIYATDKTIGSYKVDAAAERIKEINPELVVNTYKVFYSPETAQQFNFNEYDYIVDAIDTVSAKIELIVNAELCKTPIISCMGTGNKTDPTAFEVSDIYKTCVCPLAKAVRYELKKRGVKKLKVVYSKELPVKPLSGSENQPENSVKRKKQIPASNAFVPGTAGLIIAGEVVKDLLNM